MHAAHLLTVSQHALLEGCVTAPGVYLPMGCTCLGGVPSQGMYLPRGRGAQGYLPRDGGVLAWGVPAGGMYLPEGCTCPGTPSTVNRMTDRCKNITLPQTSFVGGNETVLYLELIVNSF